MTTLGITLMVTIRHCWPRASWACHHHHRKGHLRRASPTPAFHRVVAALSVSAALVLAACGSAGSAGTPAAAQGSVEVALPPDHGVQLVVTGTSNEERPELPAEGRALLTAASLADSPAGSATLLAVDGDGHVDPTRFDLTPRRGSQVEQDPARRSTAAARTADTVAAAVRKVTAHQPGHALLAGLQEAGRRPGATVVVISSGIDTADPLDLRTSGFDLSPARLVDYLRGHDELPQLAGRTVLLALSPPAGSQPALTESSRRHLQGLWQAVVAAAGATVRVVASTSTQPAAATAVVPAVPVPHLPSLAGPPGPLRRPQVIPTELLFAPDTAVLEDPAGARRQLQGLAAQLRTAGPVTLTGHTALDDNGPAAGGPLSLRRAQVVAALLVQLGVPPAQLTGVVGVGPTQPLVHPPDDPRNRAVVIAPLKES